MQKNKEAFDYFRNLKDQIEKDFGGSLVWERMDDRVTSRIKYQLDGVSVFDEDDWPKMNDFIIDAASRLHKVFKDLVQKLRLR